MKKLFLFLVCISALFAQDFEYVGKIETVPPRSNPVIYNGYMYSITQDSLIITDISDIDDIHDVHSMEIGSDRHIYTLTENTNLYIFDQNAIDSTYYFNILDLTDPESPTITVSEPVDYYISVSSEHFFEDDRITLFSSYDGILRISTLTNAGEITTIDSILNVTRFSEYFNVDDDFLTTSIEIDSTLFWMTYNNLTHEIILDTLLETAPDFYDVVYNDSLSLLVTHSEIDYGIDGVTFNVYNLTEDPIEHITSLFIEDAQYINFNNQDYIHMDRNYYFRTGSYYINLTDIEEISYGEFNTLNQNSLNLFNNDDEIIYFTSHPSIFIAKFDSINAIPESNQLSYGPVDISNISTFVAPDSTKYIFLHYEKAYNNHYENTHEYTISDADSIEYSGSIPGVSLMSCEWYSKLSIVDSLLFTRTITFDSTYSGIGVYKIEDGDYSQIALFSDFYDVNDVYGVKTYNNRYVIVAQMKKTDSSFFKTYILEFTEDGNFSMIDSSYGDDCELNSLVQAPDSSIYILQAYTTIEYLDEYNIELLERYPQIDGFFIKDERLITYSSLWLHSMVFDFYPPIDTIESFRVSTEYRSQLFHYVSESDQIYFLQLDDRSLHIYSLNESLELNHIATKDDFIDPYIDSTYSYSVAGVLADYLIIYETHSFNNTGLLIYHIPSEILVDYEISEGWNMLSYPFNGKSVSDGLFPFAVGPLYNYDPESGYIPADTITCNHGFWLLSDRDTTVSFSSLATAQFYEDTLKRGFNLIGMPGTPLPASAILDYPHTIGGAYEYVPSLRTYTEPDTLTPTKGYWIFADSIVPYRLGL